MVAAEPQNTSERAQNALANFVVMTVSSDAFVDVCLLPTLQASAQNVAGA
jgi:hypothetical protein